MKSTIYILLDASATTALTLSSGTTQSPSRCVDVVAGLDVHGGADVDFYGLFDKSTFLPIYQRSYDIFKVYRVSAHELALLTRLSLEMFQSSFRAEGKHNSGKAGTEEPRPCLSFWQTTGFGLSYRSLSNVA